MGGGSGSTNAAPTQGVSAMQASTAPVAATPVSTGYGGNMNAQEYQQWNGISRGNQDAIMFGAKAAGDAANQAAKGFSTKGPAGTAWSPNQGYQFMTDLYKIKR